jgi:hypothetical protein
LVGGSWPGPAHAVQLAYEPPGPADEDADAGLAEPADGDAALAGSGAHPGSAAEPAPDAPAAAVAADIKVTVSPIQGSEVRFGDAAEWTPVPESGVLVHSIDHPMTITARNPCCEMFGKEVRVGQPSLVLDMVFKAGRVLATCDYPDTTVQIDDNSATLGKPTPIWFDGTLDSKTAKVTFIGRDKVDTRTVQVRSGKTTEVRCAW